MTDLLKEHETLILREVRHRAGVLYRPVNESSRRFAVLLRQVTLTERDVVAIKDLGFEVRVIRPSETEEAL